jgi:hypothetical protein
MTIRPAALAGLALVLAAVSAPNAAASGQAGAVLSISEHFSCPETFQRGALIVEPTGAATLYVTIGLDPRRRRSSTHRKQLSPQEAEELTAVVRGSGYASIPETSFDASGERRHEDACRRSIEITLDGKTKRIAYDRGTDNPSALDALLKGIHAILDRHEWKEDR